MVNNPLTLLKLQVDPILKNVSTETPIIGNPLLEVLKKTILKGVEVPPSNILELAQPYSIPVATIGDSWQYRAMQSNLATGKCKFKKFTLQSVASEDELDRLYQLGEGSLIAAMKADELKRGILFLRDQLSRYANDPWGGVTTSPYYDANIVGLFAASSGGTISNPSDLNAVAGTPLATGLSMSGANQSTRVVEQIAAEIKKGFVKIDAKTGARIPVSRIYAGVHPLLKSILDSTSDILDSTSGYRSPNSMTEDFAKKGITVIEDIGFDASYAAGEDDLATMRCFADPDMDFEMLGIKPKEGDGWTEWDDFKEINGDVMTIGYEKHKKLECAFRPMAYAVFTTAAATSPTFFKKVFNLTVVGYNNV